jgi:hypothetical protein
MNRITGVCLFLLLLSFIAPKGHAFTAFCGSVPVSENSNFTEEESNHRLIYSSIDFDCLFKHKGKGNWGGANISLKTYGPGLQIEAFEGVMISCPLVSQKRLGKMIKKHGSWSAVGVGVSANALLGGRVGVALNQRGALCFVTGLSALSLGAAAGAIHIKIDEDPSDTEVQFHQI